MTHSIHRVQRVPAPKRVVTEFFEDPRNLQELTPPFLHFRILTDGPIPMHSGALIDYSIKLYGLPMRWKTCIEEYVPQERFIDRQLRGPYTYWHHTHTFSEIPGGTEIVDLVRYEVPLGPLGVLAHSVFVRRQLGSIFDYRRRVVEKKFGTYLAPDGHRDVDS